MRAIFAALWSFVELFALESLAGLSVSPPRRLSSFTNRRKCSSADGFPPRAPFRRPEAYPQVVPYPLETDPFDDMAGAGIAQLP